MVKVKICGITNLEDAAMVASSGADALGYVFYKGSPRHIEPRIAGGITASIAPFITIVGVFVDSGLDHICSAVKEAGLGCVQLHGGEDPSFCEAVARAAGVRVIKALRVRREGSTTLSGVMAGYAVSAYLLDTYVEGAHGGTGKAFDWDIAAEAKKAGRIILSGGLTPENVGGAVSRVRPYAVDVSSGVEAAPGRKDAEKVKRFVEAAKKAL